MTGQDILLSRRHMLGSGLVIGVALAIGPTAKLFAQAPGAAPPPSDPNAFVRIAPDDTVTVLSKHIEFGQGPWTGLTTLVAEELDADWAQMRCEHSLADAKVYQNNLFHFQGTGGSSSIANSYEQMRRIGATARAMLVQAAAQSWGVPAGQISVEKGVIKGPGGRKSGFGAFADAAARLPMPTDVPLKDPKKFTLIGADRGVPKLDSRDKTTGKAMYSIDQTGPGMLNVVVAHPPRFGAKVRSFDPAKALAVKGVVAVKQIPTGVAVYAHGTWPAIKGRKALVIAWDDSKAEPRSSAQMSAAYLKKARAEGTIAAGKGEVDKALATPGATVIEADYSFPYLAHAPMEPLGGYLEWDGKQAVARFGSQLQSGDHPTIAKVLGLPIENVRLETVLAGGSFGRRGQPDNHFAAELAECARAIGPGKPVKLTWTREDDIQGGYYRPLMVHHMKGAVKDGKIIAWSDSIVGQSFARGTSFEKMMIHNNVDAGMVEGATDLPYEIADFRCTVQEDPTPVTTLFWRSVGSTHTAYVVETFVDRLIEAAGKDPVAGRLELMDKDGRHAGVLKAVARLANWGSYKPPEGHALGVAVVESFSTFVAEIAEVSIDQYGEPKVHKVWAAVDCGVAVNPDVVRAQVEGGIGFAAGHILYAEVPIEAGRPTVANFNDYRSLRVMEMPVVEVVILDSKEKPTGIGEPGVPPCGPAIANALARLGRERPTTLPMVKRA
jgi:isoquinoline 1-oxidoreductase beta subunit